MKGSNYSLYKTTRTPGLCNQKQNVKEGEEKTKQNPKNQKKHYLGCKLF
jgi:hypothetical protein